MPRPTSSAWVGPDRAPTSSAMRPSSSATTSDTRWDRDAGQIDAVLTALGHLGGQLGAATPQPHLVTRVGEEHCQRGPPATGVYDGKVRGHTPLIMYAEEAPRESP